MSNLQAFILAIVQGLTEFLPISSSGHLVLVPWILGWELDHDAAFAFDVLSQVGTIFAVIVYFWRDLWSIATGWIQAVLQRNPFGSLNARLGWLLILGSIPAAVLGVLFEDTIKGFFSQPVAAFYFLYVTAAVLLISEWLRTRGTANKAIEDLNWVDALAMGFGQALALLPGVSRSGSTIATGLIRGLSREAAARFSFLMAVPIMLGAGLFTAVDLVKEPSVLQAGPQLLIGVVVSAAVGMAAIHWLLNYLRKRSLLIFAVYCIAVATLGLIWASVR